MGRNNKERRAAKAKARSRARAQQQHQQQRGSHQAGDGFMRGGPGPRSSAGYDGPSAEELASMFFALGAESAYHDQPIPDFALAKLAELPARTVDREAELTLLAGVRRAWAHGWQPAELVRQARLTCRKAPAARLVARAVAADHAGRGADTMDDRWAAQVEHLGLTGVAEAGWLAVWAADEGLDRVALLESVMHACSAVSYIPPLDELIPPPGTEGVRSAPAAGGASGADPLLDRIRALLAKAESTTFEAEAAALTAKAQELMTRHALDSAMVAAKGEAGDGPVMIRVPIDSPYVDVKSLLLQTVAEASRCRTVFHHGLAMSTVIGFADDVAAVELLFTSLLVQAQTALHEAGRNAPPGTRTRSQQYRQSFLQAFGQRIGQRLREINEAVFAEVATEHGESFLPVLRSREHTIDDAVSARFGELTASRVRWSRDLAGWASGQVAADNAELTSGHLDDGDRAAADPPHVRRALAA